MTEGFQTDGEFDIYKMLDIIRPRPRMYLGKESLTKLWWFLFGYQRALEHNSIPFKDRLWGVGRFEFWVLRKYRLPSNTKGYADIMREKCGGDEAKALAKFFELLDEFRRQEDSE